MKYYGEYQSSTAGTTGCVKRLVSKEKETPHFPPQVSYHCDLCDTTHGFRLRHMHMVGTPRQQERFDEFADRSEIERDVILPDKVR